jgi:hypothetical protein
VFGIRKEHKRGKFPLDMEVINFVLSAQYVGRNRYITMFFYVAGTKCVSSLSHIGTARIKYREMIFLFYQHSVPNGTGIMGRAGYKSNLNKDL